MPNKLNKVKHVVVLMLENRSFDHLLGYLKALGIKPAIDGLTGTETIPTDPVLGTGPVTVRPTRQAQASDFLSAESETVVYPHPAQGHAKMKSPDLPPQ
jgi:phospholipase C